MGVLVSQCAGSAVDLCGVDHGETEIGVFGDEFELMADALLQLVRWQAAAYGQTQFGKAGSQCFKYWCSDRQMPEAVAGNVGEEVQFSSS